MSQKLEQELKNLVNNDTADFLIDKMNRVPKDFSFESNERLGGISIEEFFASLRGIVKQIADMRDSEMDAGMVFYYDIDESTMKGQTVYVYINHINSSLTHEMVREHHNIEE